MASVKSISRRMGSTSDEVVEDSEPEREAARMKRKEERQRRGAESGSPSRSVIVITDNGLSSPLQVATGPIVISTADASDSATSSPKLGVFPECLSSPGPGSSREHLNIGPSMKSNPFDTESHGKLLAESDSIGESDDELDETTSRMRSQLNRFAFSKLTPTPLSRTPSLASCRPPTPPADKIRHADKTSRTKDTTALVGFSERQLVPLRKCVSCNIAWTTRKTAVQKMSHIRTCARKMKIMDETLKDLISKELDSLPPEDVPKTKGKRKKAQLSEDTPPKTLLDDVVGDPQVTRVRKRQVTASSSVKDVTETRDVILDKARQLLHQSLDTVPRENALRPPPQTQAFGESRLKNTLIHISTEIQGPPPTQAFGESSLANRFSARPSLFSAEPPATQAFAPSRLGSVLQGSSCWAESNSSSTVRYRNHSLVESPTCLSPEGNDVSLEEFNSMPCGEPQDKQIEYDNGLEEPYEDEAILIYEPVRDIDAGTHLNQKESRLLKILDEQITNIESEDAELSTIAKSTMKTRTKATHKKIKKVAESTKGARKKIIDEEELARRLKARILGDDELYMRILRYEPLHFDVFLSLIKEDNIDAASLKTKVRVFLDKHAIHFHENEPGQRGRRRR